VHIRSNEIARHVHGSRPCFAHMPSTGDEPDGETPLGLADIHDPIEDLHSFREAAKMLLGVRVL
jgi:hypothetical protein